MSAPYSTPTWEQPSSTPKARAWTWTLGHVLSAVLIGVLLGASVVLAWKTDPQPTESAPADSTSDARCANTEVTDFGGNCVDANTYAAAEAEAEGIYQMGKDSFEFWLKSAKHPGKNPELTFFCAKNARWDGAFYVADKLGWGPIGASIGVNDKSGATQSVVIDRRDPLGSLFRCDIVPNWAKPSPKLDPPPEEKVP